MSIKRILSALAFFLIFPMAAEPGQKIITLNYPPDKTVMELDLLGISLSLPLDSADLITVSVNDAKEIEIIPDSQFECFSVPLSLGINKIDIRALRKVGAIQTRESVVDEARFSVFRRSDLVSAYKDPPAGFQKNYFHMKNPPECAACHELRSRESDRKAINLSTFSAETSVEDNIAAASTCYSCHSKITSYPYVHGPTSVWSCLSCHDPQTVPLYSVKKPDTDLCFNCHTEQKREWVVKEYIHGPVNIGKCDICHSPHASDNPFNLFKPAWDLCVSCHETKGTGKHIFVSFSSGEGHPTRDREDPLRKGKKLTCVSCHNPHASNFPKLWALNAQSQLDLCLKCHKY